MAIFKENFCQDDRSGSYDYAVSLIEAEAPQGAWVLSMEVTRDDLGWVNMYEENADSFDRDRPVESMEFHGTLQEIIVALEEMAQRMVSGFRKFQPGEDGDKEHWRWCDRDTPGMITKQIVPWIKDESKEEEEE